MLGRKDKGEIDGCCSNEGMLGEADSTDTGSEIDAADVFDRGDKTTLVEGVTLGVGSELDSTVLEETLTDGEKFADTDKLDDDDALLDNGSDDVDGMFEGLNEDLTEELHDETSEELADDEKKEEDDESTNDELSEDLVDNMLLDDEVRDGMLRVGILRDELFEATDNDSTDELELEIKLEPALELESCADEEDENDDVLEFEEIKELDELEAEIEQLGEIRIPAAVTFPQNGTLGIGDTTEEELPAPTTEVELPRVVVFPVVVVELPKEVVELVVDVEFPKDVELNEVVEFLEGVEFLKVELSVVEELGLLSGASCLTTYE
jgi:hypothetical protein